MLADTNLILDDAIKEFKSSRLVDKVASIFLLLLPIGIFTERSIMDIFFTIFALIASGSALSSFLGSSAMTKNYEISFRSKKHRVFLFCFCLFWSVCLASSPFSQMPVVAFQESLAWLRFPLFVLACLFWLPVRPSLFKLLIALSLMCLLGLCLVSYVEFLFNLNQWTVADNEDYSRLSWPYGDSIVGSVYAKFFVGPLIVAGYWSQSRSVTAMIGFRLLLFFWCCALVLSGERINTIIGLSVVFLFLINSKVLNNKELVLGLLFTCGIFIGAVLLNHTLFLKFLNFFDSISKIMSTGYGHLWMSGIEIWKENFWLGSGAATYRDLCEPFQNSNPLIQRCDNHPHNHYIQLLAETGLLGFLSFLALYLSLITLCHSNKKSVSGMWAVPLVFFFPIQSTGDFFGQWFNIMMWFSIGVTICFVEISERNA
jgi:O-antigen ligase